MIALGIHVSSSYRLIADINIEHLKELQRFAQVGRVSAGLIHDISSPLTAAMLHLDEGDLARIPNISHAKRSMKVLERYIEAARRQLNSQDEPCVFFVSHEANQIRHILAPLARSRNIHLNFISNTDNSSLFGDPVKFQRIITNLATNAMDAAEDASEPLVSVILEVRDNCLAVSVNNNGKGLEDNQVPHLFKPFYSTKRSGAHGGTGIGLSIVRHYTEDIFGGQINIDNHRRMGTNIMISLPLHST